MRGLFLLCLILVMANSPAHAAGLWEGHRAYQEGENSVRQSQLESANAFRELVFANADAGISTTPHELEQLRDSMSSYSPNPFMPSDNALKQLAEMANRRAEIARMKVKQNIVEARFGNQGSHLSKESEDDMKLLLGVAKKAAGFIGAANACGNSKLEVDAIHLHEAVMDTMQKRKLVKKEDVPYMHKMGQKTALQTKEKFTKNPPVPCSQLPNDWNEFKKEFEL